MLNSVGIDSRKFVRTGNVNDFVSIIGIGVEVKNYEYFKEKYFTLLESLLKKRGITIDRPSYKSYDLKRLGLDHTFYKEFYTGIVGEIENLHLFYSYFMKTDNVKEVKIFPFSGLKSISFIDFITEHLDPSYPHICAWSMKKQSNYNGKIFMDSFGGKVTNAWREIEHLENMFIVSNGDRTNALISTSDILLEFFDSEMKVIGGSLNIKDCEKVFNESKSANKLKIEFISNRCLSYIIPLSSSANIPVQNKFLHPIFFIFKERTENINDRTIENSPLFKTIVEKSFKNDAGFKFFDSNLDFSVISEKDYLIYFGEDGKTVVENLKNLGYSFKPINLSELKIL